MVGKIFVKNQKNLKSKQAEIIKISVQDFTCLKNFILENHEKMDDKSHFIIDDIENVGGQIRLVFAPR